MDTRYQETADGIAFYEIPATYKGCSVCNRPFTKAEWRRLPWVGTIVVAPKVIGEMRNCPCGGTLSVEHDLTTTAGLLEGFAVIAEMLEKSREDVLSTCRAVRDMLEAVRP